jgi:hypothetical protein
MPVLQMVVDDREAQELRELAAERKISISTLLRDYAGLPPMTNGGPRPGGGRPTHEVTHARQ